MWIRIANKLAKFHVKRLNRSENIPKSFRGATFFETPGRYQKLQNFNIFDLLWQPLGATATYYNF